MFRYHLLGLLQNQELHGYALMKEYRRRSGTSITPGAFYRELRTLVDLGLATRLGASQDDLRRTPYRITGSGAAVFDEWFDDVPQATPCPDNELSNRLLFFADVDPERAAKTVERWRQSLWQATREIEASLHRQANLGAGETDSAVLLLQRRLSHIATELQFLDTLRETLSLPDVGTEVDEIPALRSARRRRAPG